MTINKIKETNRNEVPGQGMDKNIFVKAGDFNPLVDVVNGISDTTGTLKADTITEVTSANGVSIDSVKMKDGGITHSSLVSFRVGFIAVAGQETRAFDDVARTIATTSYLTTLTAGTGGVVATMAAGSMLGQLKKIYMTACGAGGSVVLTLAAGSFVGYNTWTFNAVGETVTFINSTSGWYPIEILGATGATV